MPAKVDIYGRFRRELKRLGRKYPSVVQDVAQLITQLENDERPGDKIPSVSHDVYKVRLRNPSAGKGKRGGFRAIYYLRTADRVILMTIYSKSEQADISVEVLRRLIEELIRSDDPDH